MVRPRDEQRVWVVVNDGEQPIEGTFDQKTDTFQLMNGETIKATEIAYYHVDPPASS